MVSIQPKPKKGLVGVFHLLKPQLPNSFNPAEAEEGFSSILALDHYNAYCRFNPAEAEEGFSRSRAALTVWSFLIVSIQPKPKKGLVVDAKVSSSLKIGVSIQPKPKKGLVDTYPEWYHYEDSGFNPAEAEEGFSRYV